MLWLIDLPPPDTRTRSCTASDSRVEQDRASTALSERGTAGRHPESPEPQSAASTSYLEKTGRKLHHFYVAITHIHLKLLYFHTNFLLKVYIILRQYED